MKTRKAPAAALPALLLAALLSACAAPQAGQAPAPQRTAALETDSTPLTRNETREAQSLLARLGFGAGAADGVAGPRSRAAAESYQASIGAPVTGAFDRGLLVMLRRSAEQAGLLPPPPPPVSG